MLESFIAARDKYLKPGGMMMPSTADILVAPFTDEQLFNEQNTKSTFWDSNSFYGIDLTPLAVQAKEEYMSQAVVGYFSPDILVSCDKVKHAIDFRTASMRDLQVFEIPVHFRITKTCLLHGLACWYVTLYFDTIGHKYIHVNLYTLLRFQEMDIHFFFTFFFVPHATGLMRTSWAAHHT
jgi:type I protein arginine methyltransferase